MNTETLPYNPTTGNIYQGANIGALITQAAERGFNAMQFAGYAQWLKAGRIVKKGEKAIYVKACGTFTKIDKATGKATTGTFAKGQAVFAIEQTEEKAAQ